MPFKKNNPGCNARRSCKCGQACPPIASDSFNRPDNFEDINDGAPFEWEGTNENIWIVDNALMIVSGAPEALTCPTPHPDSTGSGVVSAKFKGDSGDVVRVWLNGTDADNCTVAQLTIGTSQTLKIIIRVGGFDTVVASAPLTTTAYSQQEPWLYYDAELEEAVAVVGEVSVCAADIEEVGYLSGIAVGTNTGEVLIDDFAFRRLGDGENGCPELLCPHCQIADDNFNRANNTDISTGSAYGWTEVSGAWSIASNRLTGAGSGGTPAVALCDTGGSSSAMQVTVKATGGGSVGVIGGAVDGNDYVFAEFNYTTDFITISRVASGVIQSPSISGAFNFNPANEYECSICITPEGQVTASVNGIERLTGYVSSLTGGKAGLRVASGSTVSFDDFLAERSKRPANECAECAAATPGDCLQCCPVVGASKTLIVDIPAGLTNPGSCPQCDIEGEYTTTFHGNCEWVVCANPGLFTCPGQWNCSDPLCGSLFSCDSSDFPLCASAGLICQIRHYFASNGKCFIWCGISLQGAPAGTFPRVMAFATYATPIDEDIDACDGKEWTLTIHTPADSRRGTGVGFCTPQTPGCGGSWPASITIRRA